MFIFWGTKTIVRKLGYVADFCPICRKINQFQLSRIGLASHVYGASFGKGQLVGHQKKCLDCGTDLQTDASIYKDVQKKQPGTGSVDLSASTFPNIRQYYSERLSLEEQISKRSTRIDAGTRAVLIKEPFHIMAPIAEKRFSATHIDLQVAITFLVAIAGTVLFASVFRILFPFAAGYEGEAILFAIGIGVVATGIQGYKSAGRYLRREIYPRIVRSLRPLQPNQAELETVFAELQRMDFKLAKKGKLRDLLPELADATHRA